MGMSVVGASLWVVGAHLHPCYPSSLHPSSVDRVPEHSLPNPTRRVSLRNPGTSYRVTAQATHMMCLLWHTSRLHFKGSKLCLICPTGWDPFHIPMEVFRDLLWESNGDAEINLNLSTQNSFSKGTHSQSGVTHVLFMTSCV